MNHEIWAVTKLRGNHRDASIAAAPQSYFNVTGLAVAVPTTRAKVIGLIRKHAITIEHCTSDGQALFPVAKLTEYQAAFFNDQAGR
jgi:hypothetical protein